MYFEVMGIPKKFDQLWLYRWIRKTSSIQHLQFILTENLTAISLQLNIILCKATNYFNDFKSRVIYGGTLTNRLFRNYWFCKYLFKHKVIIMAYDFTVAKSVHLSKEVKGNFFGCLASREDYLYMI